MIEIESGYKGYQIGARHLQVLEDVSLKISSGEMVSIVGPSGSGKSTLLCVLGLLDRLDRGDYRLDGRSFKDFSDRECADLRNRYIGFIFQAFHLLPSKTALENVALPLFYRGVKRSERLRKALGLLEEFGLAEWKDHLPSQLSGGQCQRVAIARALVTEPKVIFADEPTGNLDTESSARVIGILNELNKRRGTTVVLVTHDTTVARAASRTISIVDGRIVSRSLHDTSAVLHFDGLVSNV